MGINTESLDFILKTITDCDIDLNNCKMMELGNQHLKDVGGVAKHYFESLGINHTSIDINGEDNALVIDMCNPIKDKRLFWSFDVLTNFGTSEHIKDEYMCWFNIHNLVRPGGVFIHLVPRIGNWRGHGYHKYDIGFFDRLAAVNGYKILNVFIRGDVNKNFICCSMIREHDGAFVGWEVFKNDVRKSNRGI